MEQKPVDYIGYALITTLLLLLTYAGYLSYKSIDWTILERMESKNLILPTPAVESLIASPSAEPIVTKATPNPKN
ncbi:MAG: hypothetical protein Q8P53_00130 [Candidatus Shapirobacteria bacterium]|nr:hypothetical protein [Candidatus Shapirobacteria bacterium]